MALNQKEFDLLASLAESEGRLTQRELAEKTGCALGTVNRILRQAEENGLVRDGRITSAGETALEPYRVRRAVFIAAGFGSRMVPITFNTPKPLVRVHGIRIIEHKRASHGILCRGSNELRIGNRKLAELLAIHELSVRNHARSMRALHRIRSNDKRLGQRAHVVVGD